MLLLSSTLLQVVYIVDVDLQHNQSNYILWPSFLKFYLVDKWWEPSLKKITFSAKKMLQCKMQTKKAIFFLAWGRLDGTFLSNNITKCVVAFFAVYCEVMS